MAITTLAGYRASWKQTVPWIKSAAVASQTAFMPATMFDKAGIPGAGSMDPGNSDGVVPVGSDVGYPLIQPFSGSGYITKVEYMNSVTSWLYLYDRVFVSGRHGNNSYVQPLTSPPSFASRMPGGTDFAGTELWVECVTTAAETPDITVVYTDQAGNSGHTTGVYTLPSALLTYRCHRIPLADGDTGISMIESLNIANTTMYVAILNLMILRPLWSGPVTLANGDDTHDMLKTGLVEVFPATALYPLIAASSTATGTPKLMIEIANG